MNKLTEELVSFCPAVSDWKEAIKISSKLLLEKEYINQTYVDNMIQNVEKFGPYIVIAPQIAMPHSRPEHGVLKGGYSVTVFDNDIDVCGNAARVFVTLACSHNTEHLEMIQKIAIALSNEEKLNQFIEAKNENEIIQILEGEQ